jgi:hypothetical protein
MHVATYIFHEGNWQIMAATQNTAELYTNLRQWAYHYNTQKEVIPTTRNLTHPVSHTTLLLLFPI